MYFYGSHYTDPADPIVAATNVQQNEMVIPFEINMKDGFAPEINCMVDNEINVSAIIDTGFPGIAALPFPMVKKTNAFKNGKIIEGRQKASLHEEMLLPVFK
ncbi:hypothetical protein MHK_008938 [Candidatus Magnetomorum sp. HK-1]|nr:hypothetical protein MHK_008938 [Candidatus Magnetomorum sp. HK-1]